MSAVMGEEIKHWTARRKSALVLEIIQGKTTVAEASRAFDITPSEIEVWVEDGKRGLENALRAKREDVREQYERQLKDFQEARGEAMLELRARINLRSYWARTRPDSRDPAGSEGRRDFGVDGAAVLLVRVAAANSVLPPDEGTGQREPPIMKPTTRGNDSSVTAEKADRREQHLADLEHDVGEHEPPVIRVEARLQPGDEWREDEDK